MYYSQTLLSNAIYRQIALRHAKLNHQLYNYTNVLSTKKQQLLL